MFSNVAAPRFTSLVRPVRLVLGESRGSSCPCTRLDPEPKRPSPFLLAQTAPRAFLLPLLRREYRVAASDLRAKHLIDHDGKKLEVVDMHAAMMGRRPTSIHIDARDLATGKVFKFRFNTGDKVERIMLDSQEYEFLYREGEVAYLMHPVTFEQMEVPASLFGSQLPYLLPNSKVSVVLFRYRFVLI